MAKAEIAASSGASLEDLRERYGAAYPWLVAVTVLSAFSTAVLTSSIVNVAVPDVMGGLRRWARPGPVHRDRLFCHNDDKPVD